MGGPVTPGPVKPDDGAQLGFLVQAAKSAHTRGDYAESRACCEPPKTS